MISALGVYLHQLWMMWLGSGIIGGCGLGLGYISPVSTLIKWFPDRRGMATGMAIMGFGGGAMIGSPLATMLMNHYATPDLGRRVGDLRHHGPHLFRVHARRRLRLSGAGRRLEARGLDAAGQLKRHDHDRERASQGCAQDVQFWLIWVVLCLNVSAGIGIIGAASPMLQETFGGRLFGDPSVGFGQFSDEQKANAALVGAAFVGLFSLFNIAGRFFWASLSDTLGRKATYFTFFTLGFLCYAAAPTLATLGMLGVFAAAFCLIASMYGGGFATIPAYLADIFGTQFVGAIHGRLLTAWSTAGIVGPVIVNYMHDARKAEGIPPDQIYHPIFYVLAGLLVAGFIANLLIRPLHKKWFMSEEEVAALQAKLKSRVEFAESTAVKGGFDLKALLAWAAVGIPLAWGIWITLEKALVLFM